MARFLHLTSLLVAVLVAGANAQTDPVAKARLDKQGSLITQLAKRLVTLEGTVKAGTDSVTIADVDERIRLRAVELPSVRPSGLWARRESEEAKFRSDLRTELNGFNDDLDELERASAHPKRGERKAAIRAIRANRGW